MPDPKEPRRFARRFLTPVLALAIALLLGTLLVLLERGARVPEESTRVEAPPGNADLIRHQEAFRTGLDALTAGDAPAAIAAFESFTFGHRAVEEYRLYDLAKAYELEGNRDEARRTLARLWRRSPRLAARDDSGFDLASSYESAGDWIGAARIQLAVARGSTDPSNRARARLAYLESRGRRGDAGAVVAVARSIVIDEPGTAEASAATGILQALVTTPRSGELPLSIDEQVRRIENLVAQGHSDVASLEISRLRSERLPKTLAQRLVLARATMLERRGKYDDVERDLMPLLNGNQPLRAEALRMSVGNLAKMADELDALQVRHVARSVRVNRVRSNRDGSVTRIPTWRVIHETIRVKNPRLEKRREGILEERARRLETILTLPIDRKTRIATLHDLAAHWERLEDEAALRQVVGQLVKIDPSTREGIQLLWSSGWKAFESGDNAHALDRFEFLRSTYADPSIQRQASYWAARCMQREGDRAEAHRIFAELALAPYDDLYALLARHRLGRPVSPAVERPDPATEGAIAIPPELRIANELAIMGIVHEARLEIQRNRSSANKPVADAILAETFFRQGAWEISCRYLRRAFPRIATVEQSSVPLRYLRMYYANRYGDEIMRMARDQGVDPFLVLAIIHQESSFEPTARSSAGAIGLMQIMPSTGLELGRATFGTFSVGRLTDPATNLALGTRYLRQLIDMMNGDTLLAIAGYNGGPYRIRNWQQRNRRPLDEFLENLSLSETRSYVKRIVILRSSYERLWKDLHDPEAR